VNIGIFLFGGPCYTGRQDGAAYASLPTPFGPSIPKHKNITIAPTLVGAFLLGRVA